MTRRNLIKGIATMKATSMILDYNLYPRNHIEQQTVTDYVAALKAGAKFPPIVADRKSLRVVDGFNRVTAYLRWNGDDAEIEVDLRDYASEEEMLLEAGRINWEHGARLSHYDIRRYIALCQEREIDEEDVSASLHMTIERLHKFAENIHIGSDGRLVPGKQVSRHIDGKLTKKQERGIRSSIGGRQAFLIRQVIMLIESDLLDMEDEGVIEGLEKLVGLAGKVLRGRKKVA